MNEIADCPICGGRNTMSPTTAQRVASHKGHKLTLPAMTLPTCAACNEAFLDGDLADQYSAAVDEAYAVYLRQSADESIAVILSRKITQKQIEKFFDLSHGYISKLRRAHTTPSFQLVQGLRLLARDPQTLIADLAPGHTTAASSASFAGEPEDASARRHLHH